jgi:hypothetical protein
MLVILLFEAPPRRNLAGMRRGGLLTPLEVVMLIVADDRAVVEADLAAGRLFCPCCGVGVSGGWGCARLREVRTGEGCGDCGRVAVVVARRRAWRRMCCCRMCACHVIGMWWR